jgi:hypothetical protein
VAYNRENFLQRVLEIQKIALYQSNRGLFMKQIYYDYIQDKYKISKRTFDTYMGINAKKEIKELEAKKQQNG